MLFWQYGEGQLDRNHKRRWEMFGAPIQPSLAAVAQSSDCSANQNQHAADPFSAQNVEPDPMKHFK